MTVSQGEDGDERPERLCAGKEALGEAEDVAVAEPDAFRAVLELPKRPICQLDDPARSVGALLDARAVHPGRTASDHLLVTARATGLGRARVREVLAVVGLDEAADRPAGEFSLGMYQRLGIATALLGDPGVLVFDEPLNGRSSVPATSDRNATTTALSGPSWRSQSAPFLLTGSPGLPAGRGGFDTDGVLRGTLLRPVLLGALPVDASGAIR